MLNFDALNSVTDKWTDNANSRVALRLKNLISAQNNFELKKFKNPNKRCILKCFPMKCSLDMMSLVHITVRYDGGNFGVITM